MMGLTELRKARACLGAVVVLCLVVAGSARADLSASFTAQPNPAAPLQTITFDASSSLGGITSWAWDFDSDGSYDDGSGMIVEYAFPFFGVFTTTLRITDASGHTDTGTELISISLGNRAPVADAGGPYVVEIGEDVALDGSASYDPDTAFGDSIVRYEWDLDNDGAADFFGSSPVVSWASLETLGLPSGPKIIELTVIDGFGAGHTSSTTLSIVPVPAAVFLGFLGLGAAGIKLRKFA